MTQKSTAQEFTLTIQSGKNRFGEKEGFDCIEIKSGDTLSIVGPTGSGKSALINDIETLAQGDTATGRYILINGEVPPVILCTGAGFQTYCPDNPEHMLSGRSLGRRIPGNAYKSTAARKGRFA
jgi:ABC-type dipeptide/oligopeptide/nickel transport system ATPase component